MTDFMQNAYVFLWAALAVLMFLAGRKQGAFAYLLSLFFVFMTVWYGLRAFGGYKMFEGTLGIVFRCIIIAFLLLFVGIYVFTKLKKGKDKNSEDKSSDDN